MRPALICVALLFATATDAVAQSALTVGSVSAKPGEKSSGYVEIPDGVDKGVRIPVSVVNGAKSGAVLALIAGTHGYEYTSIVALPRVLARLDPARMTGAVIMVHMASPATFYGRMIYRGPDGKNLNRVYPGNAAGTISDRIADVIAREVIAKATHLADLHCGDGNESLRPYVYWPVTGDAKLDAASKEMALAFGLDHIVINRDRPREAAKSTYTDSTALIQGKPAITTESGGMGLTDEDSVEAQEAGALSLVAHLKIMEAPSVRVEKPVWIDKAEVVTSPETGVWRASVRKMQSVATGTLLGRVYDPFGKPLAEVRAPFAGEVLYVIGTPPTTKGEPLAFVGRTTETPNP